MCYPTVDTDEMTQPVCGAYGANQTVTNECVCSSSVDGFATLQECIDSCYLGACCTETLDDMDPVLHQEIMEGITLPSINPCCTITSKNGCAGTWRGIGTRCEVISFESYQLNAGCFSTNLPEASAVCDYYSNSCSIGFQDNNNSPAWIATCEIPGVGENPCCSSDNYSSSCPTGKCCATYNSIETSASGNLCMLPKVSINSLAWCGEDATTAPNDCDLSIKAQSGDCYIIASIPTISISANGDSIDIIVKVKVGIETLINANGLNFPLESEWTGSITLNGKEAYCAVDPGLSITNWSKSNTPIPLPSSCSDNDGCLSVPPSVTVRLNS